MKKLILLLSIITLFCASCEKDEVEVTPDVPEKNEEKEEVTDGEVVNDSITTIIEVRKEIALPGLSNGSIKKITYTKTDSKGEFYDLNNVLSGSNEIKYNSIGNILSSIDFDKEGRETLNSTFMYDVENRLLEVISKETRFLGAHSNTTYFSRKCTYNSDGSITVNYGLGLNAENDLGDYLTYFLDAKGRIYKIVENTSTSVKTTTVGFDSDGDISTIDVIINLNNGQTGFSKYNITSDSNNKGIDPQFVLHGNSILRTNNSILKGWIVHNGERNFNNKLTLRKETTNELNNTFITTFERTFDSDGRVLSRKYLSNGGLMAEYTFTYE